VRDNDVGSCGDDDFGAGEACLGDDTCLEDDALGDDDVVRVNFVIVEEQAVAGVR
jgi:hypothetical protein